MTATDEAGGGRSGVRVIVGGSGHATVTTGLSVLDHLLGQLALYARFDLTLENAPGSADAEVAAAGRGFGEALAPALRAEGANGFGSVSMTADEALASVALETSDNPSVFSNVDLSAAHVGGLGTDLAARFLRELAEGAGLTLHVRLIEGHDPQHVLEAIFKALGVALAEACSPA
jgi:imidazoleglycerol-phosphate dehydratase